MPTSELESSEKGAGAHTSFASVDAPSPDQKHLVDLERSEEIYLVTGGRVLILTTEILSKGDRVLTAESTS